MATKTETVGERFLNIKRRETTHEDYYYNMAWWFAAGANATRSVVLDHDQFAAAYIRYIKSQDDYSWDPVNKFYWENYT